jgi:hypothetical protein
MRGKKGAKGVEQEVTSPLKPMPQLNVQWSPKKVLFKDTTNVGKFCQLPGTHSAYDLFNNVNC